MVFWASSYRRDSLIQHICVSSCGADYRRGQVTILLPNPALLITPRTDSHLFSQNIMFEPSLISFSSFQEQKEISSGLHFLPQQNRYVHV